MAKTLSKSFYYVSGFRKVWAYYELRNTDKELARTLLFAGAVATVLYVIRDVVLT